VTKIIDFPSTKVIDPCTVQELNVFPIGRDTKCIDATYADGSVRTLGTLTTDGAEFFYRQKWIDEEMYEALVYFDNYGKPIPKDTTGVKSIESFTLNVTGITKEKS